MFEQALATGDAVYARLRRLTLLRKEPPDSRMDEDETLDQSRTFPGLTALNVRWHEKGMGDLVGLKVRCLEGFWKYFRFWKERVFSGMKLHENLLAKLSYRRVMCCKPVGNQPACEPTQQGLKLHLSAGAVLSAARIPPHNHCGEDDAGVALGKLTELTKLALVLDELSHDHIPVAVSGMPQLKVLSLSGNDGTRKVCAGCLPTQQHRVHPPNLLLQYLTARLRY